MKPQVSAARWRGFSEQLQGPTDLLRKMARDYERMLATIKENVRRFVDGKPLINVVDKRKGY